MKSSNSNTARVRMVVAVVATGLQMLAIAAMFGPLAPVVAGPLGPSIA